VRPAANGQIIEQLEQALGKSRGTPARVRNVALSAWSAGYMGVMATLAQPEAKEVDAVVLIDGMHGPRDALEHQLAPFVDYARRAAAGARHALFDRPSRLCLDDGIGAPLAFSARRAPAGGAPERPLRPRARRIFHAQSLPRARIRGQRQSPTIARRWRSCATLGRRWGR
jgi:hypothetical protein